MEYLLLSVITLFISTVLGDVKISFMKAAPRLNNSMYCDYYFACHTEGETLQWIVNNNNISDYAGQSLGHIFTGSISSCNYTATLLLLRSMPSEQLTFGSLLILSCQSSIDFTVTCSNGSVFNMANSPEKEQITRGESNISSVNLEHLLNGNLVNGESSSCTNIFVCGVDNAFLTWQIQEDDMAFTIFDEVGMGRQRVLRDNTAVNLQGILIGNEPYNLLVVMIVIESAEISVTCGYRQNTASLANISCPNNLETATSEISTVGESSTMASEGSINLPLILGLSIPFGVLLLAVSGIVVIIVLGCLYKLRHREHAEQERIEREGAELERQREHVELERIHREHAEQERIQREHAEQERIEREHAELEREQERAELKEERERAEQEIKRERAELEKERERAEQEIERERAELEKERERAKLEIERERAELEKERERAKLEIERERAELEKERELAELEKERELAELEIHVEKSEVLDEFDGATYLALNRGTYKPQLKLEDGDKIATLNPKGFSRSPGGYYPMEAKKHGVCLIISDCPDHTDHDEHNLIETWRYLGYHIEVRRQVNYKELREALKYIDELLHHINRRYYESEFEMDSFICFILAHGRGGETSDLQLKIKKTEIEMILYDSEILQEKPKIFFIGFPLNNPAEHTAKGSADTFVSYAGQRSYRHPKKGSIYVRVVCKTLCEEAQQKNLNELHNLIKRDVSNTFKDTSQHDLSTKKYQDPHESNTLTKGVHFFL